MCQHNHTVSEPNTNHNNLPTQLHSFTTHHKVYNLPTQLHSDTSHNYLYICWHNHTVSEPTINYIICQHDYTVSEPTINYISADTSTQCHIPPQHQISYNKNNFYLFYTSLFLINERKQFGPLLTVKRSYTFTKYLFLTISTLLNTIKRQCTGSNTICYEKYNSN
jgi:hypothetical protein